MTDRPPLTALQELPRYSSRQVSPGGSSAGRITVSPAGPGLHRRQIAAHALVDAAPKGRASRRRRATANSSHCSQSRRAAPRPESRSPTTQRRRADEHQIELRVDEGQLGPQQDGADRNPRPPLHDRAPSRRTRASASSRRRNRYWSSCPSSCRAGTRSPPARPSDAGACAESTSWTAPPDR